MHNRELETRVVIASGALVLMGALASAAYALLFAEGGQVWSCLAGRAGGCLAGREDVAFSMPVLVVAMVLMLLWLRERARR